MYLIKLSFNNLKYSSLSSKNFFPLITLLYNNIPNIIAPIIKDTNTNNIITFYTKIQYMVLT